MKLLRTMLLGLFAVSSLSTAGAAVALPPPEDTPEEVLRAEIILEARSPLDGEPLTAAEYAELETMLTNPEFSPTVSSDVRQLIFLLQIRRMLRTLVPPIRLLN